MRHQPTIAPEFYTLAAVQQRYGISRSTVYSWIAIKRLPQPVKLGPRAVRFRAADLVAFEAQFSDAGQPASGEAKAST